MNIVFRIFRRLKYDYSRSKDWIIRKFYAPPFVLNSFETIKYIQKNKCSITRFGDGELNLIDKYDLGFQTYNKILAIKLKEVLVSNNAKILVCIPNVFEKLEYHAEQNNFWRHHLYYTRSKWYKTINRKQIYGDAFISRFYTMRYDWEYSSIIYSELKKIWENHNIVIIEGEYSRLGVGNDCFSNASSIKRIIAPAKNAFNKYDEIITIAKTLSQNTIFILALGPTASIMAFDLSCQGYQALDLGHIDLEYEWYKKKTTEKIPIIGKFCNETFILGKQDREVFGELPQTEIDKYNSQIIYKC